MVTRIRPRLVVDLARREVPTPTDVINLITPSNFDRYRWYGLLVMPALMAVGARVLWMGRFERTLAGEPQAEKLLIVRYPSHRRFLAMTLNPYYFAINQLREAGVRHFEASFTHASHLDPGLARRKELMAVHYRSGPGDDALEPLTRAFVDAGHELVYATRATASLGILEPPAPTDPNPLSFGELALFAPACPGSEPASPGTEPTSGESEPTGSDLLATRIGELTEDFSLQLYRREPRSNYRPALRSTDKVAA